MNVLIKSEANTSGVKVHLSAPEFYNALERGSVEIAAQMIAEKIVEKLGEEVLKSISVEDIVAVAKQKASEKLIDRLEFKITH